MLSASPAAGGARSSSVNATARRSERLWRWYSVPGPNRIGNDTWKGDSWMHWRGPMWLTSSCDPPRILNCSGRSAIPGLNRSETKRTAVSITCSATQWFAIDPDGGQRKLALSVHDQRRPRLRGISCQAVVLVDRPVARADASSAAARGPRRFIYVLGRTSGRYSTPRRSSIRTGMRLDAGRPSDCAGIEFESLRAASSFIPPSVAVMNLQPPSYSARTRLLPEYREGGQTYHQHHRPF